MFTIALAPRERFAAASVSSMATRAHSRDPAAGFEAQAAILPLYSRLVANRQAIAIENSMTAIVRLLCLNIHQLDIE
ncbi:MAG TPA: hypothetical protein VNO30_11090 [Kofleriaceae bacterium]|nr:hypothetical protein [Kofleriaceae bacterium]